MRYELTFTTGAAEERFAIEVLTPRFPDLEGSPFAGPVEPLFPLSGPAQRGSGREITGYVACSPFNVIHGADPLGIKWDIVAPPQTTSTLRATFRIWRRDAPFPAQDVRPTFLITPEFAGSSPTGLVAYTFCGFVLASIALEFARGTRARHALQGGSRVAAFSDLVGRNRRRYGGYVVHAAIVLLAIGIVGSSAYDTVAEQRLQRGDVMRVGDYELVHRGAVQREGANAREVRALVDVRKDGSSLGRLAPGKNEYRAEQQTSNEVAIRSDWLTGEDLFLDAQDIYANGDVQLRVFVKPLVNLLWVAGFVFLLGSLVAMWPDAREQRRLALRYAPARA